MERARSCSRRQLYVSKNSVTGRSPTQIAPSLRHSHRNASAANTAVKRGTRESPLPAPASQRRQPKEGHQAALPHHHELLVKWSTQLLRTTSKKSHTPLNLLNGTLCGKRQCHLDRDFPLLQSPKCSSVLVAAGTRCGIASCVQAKRSL